LVLLAGTVISAHAQMKISDSVMQEYFDTESHTPQLPALFLPFSEIRTPLR
jgi:hypothetical protein